MFEVLEHTADIGFRAWGGTLPELFESAALAMCSIALDLADAAPKLEYPLAAAGQDYESLLVNWLSEILFWMDARQIVFQGFHVQHLSPTEVAGVGRGEPRDAARHPARVIVKAVTYHQLRVEQTPAGEYVAEVYLDI